MLRFMWLRSSHYLGHEITAAQSVAAGHSTVVVAIL